MTLVRHQGQKRRNHENTVICELYHFYFIYGLLRVPGGLPAAALLKSAKVFKAKKLHRCDCRARNEEAVIAQLIRSVRAQKYPGGAYRIFLLWRITVSDNTAQAAREAGAAVYERHNTYAVGKRLCTVFLIRKHF